MPLVSILPLLGVMHWLIPIVNAAVNATCNARLNVATPRGYPLDGVEKPIKMDTTGELKG